MQDMYKRVQTNILGRIFNISRNKKSSITIELTIITIPASSNLSSREKKVFLINFCSKVKNQDFDLKLQGWNYYSLKKKREEKKSQRLGVNLEVFIKKIEYFNDKHTSKIDLQKSTFKDKLYQFS